MAMSVLVALLALSPVVAASQDGHDVVSMVQRSLVSEPAGFSVGDHVLLTTAGDSDGKEGSFMKADITGAGTEMGTYNVHVWVGKPDTRNRLNVPAELLKDARPLEAHEAAEKAAQQKAEAEAKFNRWLAGAARHRAARMAAEQRKATEQHDAYVKVLTEQTKARIADYHKHVADEERLALERTVAEEAQRKAAEEAEQKLQKEEEMRRRGEEAEKASVERAKAMQAKWEQLKYDKLKAAGALNAPASVQREILMSDRYKAEQRALANRRQKAFVKAQKKAVRP